MNQTERFSILSTIKRGAFVSLALAGQALYAQSANTDTIGSFFNDGKVSFDARARYEYNSAPGPNDIHGYSLRTRLGFTSKDMNGIKAMVEFEDLSFANDNDRPALDVPVTELNQFWLGYSSEAGAGKLGRQIYTLDDHRFIGHVGWRQNIQTFDAATATFNLSSNAKLNIGYIDKVQRVNASTKSLDGIVLNASLKQSEALSLAAFGYLLDFDAPAAPLGSSDTYGIRATGSSGIWGYQASYAKQSDNSASLTKFDLDYIMVEATAKVSGATLGLGFESMEGDGVTGFSTPLATVHKFNGYADVFAGTSLGGGLKEGLDDLYIKAAYKLPIGDGVPVAFSYHVFETERGGDRIGEEYDFEAAYKLSKRVGLVAKYAFFDVDKGRVVSYAAADKTVFTLEANVSY